MLWSGIVPFKVGSHVPFRLEPWEVFASVAPLLKMIGSGKNFLNERQRGKKALCCAVLFSLLKTHTLRRTCRTPLETQELESQPRSLLVGVLHPKGTVLIAVFIEVKIKFLCVDVKPAFPSGLFILRIKNSKGSIGHAAT